MTDSTWFAFSDLFGRPGGVAVTAERYAKVSSTLDNSSGYMAKDDVD